MDGQVLQGVTGLSLLAALDGEPVRLQLTILPESVLVRLNEAETAASMVQLVADVSHMGSLSRSYVPAIPQDAA